MRLISICLFILFLSGFYARSQPLILQFIPSTDSLPALETFEVRIMADALYTNAYDPLEVSITGVFVTPHGDTLEVPGFFMQDYLFMGPDNLSPEGSPAWRIRYSPEVPGLHQWKLVLQDSTGEDTTGWQEFWCRDTLRPGFIRPGPGLYLRQDKGKAFFPIGENMAWSIPEGSFLAYQEWIDSLSAYGGNFIKIMMVPWSLGIEWNDTGLGDYTQRQDRARHLDWLLDYCRGKGVYVQLCFLIHDELTPAFNNAWAQNPYNATMGGPCQNPIDFFSNTQAKKLFLQRLQYILARWGHHPAIMSWEILSEADRVDQYSQNKSLVTSWLKSVSDWLHANDRHQRMVTAGFASSTNDPFFWADTGTAYTQLHLYALDPDLEAEVYLTAQDYIQTYNKKYILGEFALSHHPDTVYAYDPEGIAFRNSLWTSALSGSMGCGKTWWWDNYIHPYGHYAHFQGVASVFQHYGQLDDHHHPIRPRIVTSNPDTLKVYPRFLDLFAKAPENAFAVEPGGLMFPIAKKLGKYLYGKGFVTAPFRNPPSFNVYYPVNGEFIMRTGNYAPAPSLSVSIDGLVVWSSSVTPNTEYSIPISQGQHQILVENAGHDNSVCEIEHYLFTPYRSEARAFALRGNHSALGWIQRQGFHWPQWYASPSPALLDSSTMLLMGFPDSLYTIEWLNPWNGQAISSQAISGSADSLVIPIPAFQFDIAFSLKPGAVSGLHEKPVKTESLELQAYPNPSSGEMNICLWLVKDMEVKLDILDSAGRVVHMLYQGRLGAGKRAWLWDPAQQGVRPGLYIVRVMSGQSMRTIKLIIK